MKATVARSGPGLAGYAAWQNALAGKIVTMASEDARDGAKKSLDYPGPQSPSRPGEAPNSQSGALHNGITAHTTGLAAVVESVRPDGNLNVPGYLEFGTSQMEPRPYMTPAYDETRHGIERIARKAVRETRYGRR